MTFWNVGLWLSKINHDHAALFTARISNSFFSPFTCTMQYGQISSPHYNINYFISHIILLRPTCLLHAASSQMYRCRSDVQKYNGLMHTSQFHSCSHGMLWCTADKSTTIQIAQFTTMVQLQADKKRKREPMQSTYKHINNNTIT